MNEKRLQQSWISIEKYELTNIQWAPPTKLDPWHGNQFPSITCITALAYLIVLNLELLPACGIDCGRAAEGNWKQK